MKLLAKWHLWHDWRLEAITRPLDSEGSTMLWSCRRCDATMTEYVPGSIDDLTSRMIKGQG